MRLYVRFAFVLTALGFAAVAIALSGAAQGQPAAIVAAH